MVDFNVLSPYQFWSIILLLVMEFIAGGFSLGAVRNPIFLVVVVVLFAIVSVLLTWNTCYARKSIVGFISQYPDAEPRTVKDGQFVKVSGVVTCGNVPLESSFQKLNCDLHCFGCYRIKYRSCTSKCFILSNVSSMPMLKPMCPLKVIEFPNDVHFKRRRAKHRR
ncbi:hypothetical protein K7X08_006955 [Anisodus acutangulus]|uniref:Uncharacterized protein n=1 Tax=Anisodus acutangulus TaxID=402998 RepID=A0A9Q1LFL7_9SOLA|nr:hypothetical protein K7X08_006955 [Anisodus acutangulus]